MGVTNAIREWNFVELGWKPKGGGRFCQDISGEMGLNIFNSQSINHFAPKMTYGDVRFLHPGGAVDGYNDGQIAMACQGFACASG